MENKVQDVIKRPREEKDICADSQSLRSQEADFPMSGPSSCRYLGLRIILVCLPGIYGVGEELGFRTVLSQ